MRCWTQIFQAAACCDQQWLTKIVKTFTYIMIDIFIGTSTMSNARGHRTGRWVRHDGSRYRLARLDPTAIMDMQPNKRT